MELQQLTDLLDTAEVDYEVAGGEGDPSKGEAAVVVLPGERRLKTNALFIPQDGMFRVEAFVCRAVEEAHAEVYRLLLQHNRKAIGVHYTLDNNNDIYLAGQFSDTTSAQDVQRVLGQILELADGDFNHILELGFETSIRREWEWRLDRGEPTKNLEAFQRLRPGYEEERRAEREARAGQAAQQVPPTPPAPPVP
ncbi:MAG: YbjN domain-containing protein [Mycobacteriaceae bacterium]|uniref:YbjN domain-containing protein n=1 Tax=Corynebacterium sp. TaxID=1720 RepID=UPI003F9D1D4C